MTMLDERPTTATGLPAGVYRIGRQTFRDIPRFKGFVREDGSPWRSTDDGERFEVHDYIPTRCIVPPDDADEAELEEQRRKAARAMVDFLHPEHGWLRGGTKREQEHPDNLGSGSVKYRRERTASPVVPETALNDGPEAHGAGAPVDTARAGRRGPGRPRREEHSLA